MPRKAGSVRTYPNLQPGACLGYRCGPGLGTAPVSMRQIRERNNHQVTPDRIRYLPQEAGARGAAAAPGPVQLMMMMMAMILGRHAGLVCLACLMPSLSLEFPATTGAGKKGNYR
ncbi:hypothetical protein R1flu_015330 [Riccia fluitans]|uniref:Uncharacterized protein n=1 Tax=Riccia fluitans TaxID=41844 RepID=A0ABD1YJQ1_9MARC